MTKKEYMDMYDVVGAAMEVYNTLGRGMAEAIYQESLAKEFKLRGMDAEREKPLYSYYKGVLLDKIYYADFYYKDIVIELKSVEEVVSDHRAQLFNYMRLTKKPCGILVNFSPKYATIERYLYDAENGNILSIEGNVIK